MSPLEFINDRRKEGGVRVAVTWGGVVLLVGLLTAAINSQRDIADLKREKLDAARFVSDSINRSRDTKEILRELRNISCRQVRAAAQCEP